ncbi:MAG: nucleotidyl transferase AbiEii/AbiGii toxin family protein [Mycobacteriales bacterium]
MRYASPAAFRVALETRLLAQSRESGVDLNRLRRRAVFERILSRLEGAEPGRWVLKGGMALEVRWRDRARSTRDLDLALRGEVVDAAGLRIEIIDALSQDNDGDWLQFTVAEPRVVLPDELGRPGWRFGVAAQLAGKTFATVSVDVVVRPDELTRTERLRLPGALEFAGIETADVEAVDRAQHFAEKLHALTRTYGERPNTRVKDLPDLLLLIEDGVTPSAEMRSAVESVFAARGTHPVPNELPDPPAAWDRRYADLAADLDIRARTIDQAMETLRAFWSESLSTIEEH